MGLTRVPASQDGPSPFLPRAPKLSRSLKLLCALGPDSVIQNRWGSYPRINPSPHFLF